MAFKAASMRASSHRKLSRVDGHLLAGVPAPRPGEAGRPPAMAAAMAAAMAERRGRMLCGTRCKGPSTGEIERGAPCLLR